MFINMGDMFEVFEVDFETYLEDRMMGKQKLRAPKEIIIANFMQTVNQIANDRRPIKIRMTRPEVVWDNFDNKEIVLTNEVSFSNNAMIAWEESNNIVNKEA